MGAILVGIGLLVTGGYVITKKHVRPRANVAGFLIVLMGVSIMIIATHQIWEPLPK